MRRYLTVLTALSLLALAPVALAVSGEEENYLDKFKEEGSYSGSDGSLDWIKPWTEVLESDGPSAGTVRVEENDYCAGGNCLVIEGSGLLQLTADGAFRLADLSMFEKAKLSYTLGFDPGEDLLEAGTADLVVEVTIDGGLTWVIVDKVLGLTEQKATTRSVDVSLYIDPDFGVRFTVIGALGTETAIDNVEIRGSLPASTTTTTTTTSTTTTTTTTSTTTTTTTTSTTTTSSTTTTTAPDSDSTTTTTTAPDSDSTTTAPDSDSTTTTTTAPDSDSTTTASSTTTSTVDVGDTTTTVAAGAGGGDDDPGGDGTGPESGLRQTSIGVGSDIPRGLFGSAPEVLGFEIDTGFSSAVELVEASWLWVLGLALIISVALIKGVDRRFDREGAPDPPA